MLGNLIKRKIDADRLANVFVNSILQITENGFNDIKEGDILEAFKTEEHKRTLDDTR